MCMTALLNYEKQSSICPLASQVLPYIYDYLFIHVFIYFQCILVQIGQLFCMARQVAVTTLTHNGVLGACLLAWLYAELLLMPCRVGVSEPEEVHLSRWVLPVHLDRHLSLAKNLDILDSRDVWEGYKYCIKTRNRVYISDP